MTEDIVAEWRVHVQQILDRMGITRKDAAQYTGISESTVYNWTDPENTKLPDLRLVSKFVLCLGQPLRPALAAAGLPPEQLGIEGAEAPEKTVDQMILELAEIADKLRRIAADPENPPTAKRKGVMSRLLRTNPEYSPRQDRPPL